jgi:hypothetical protein
VGLPRPIRSTNRAVMLLPGYVFAYTLHGPVITPVTI